jgi:two-component system, sensor histidine kinase and response regulator
MTIETLYRRDFTVINPYVSVAEIKHLLLKKCCLVMMEGEKYAGLLTIRDIVENPKVLAVDCIKPTKELHPEMTVKEVTEVMVREGSEFLPVLEGDAFKGILFYSDLLGCLEITETALSRSERKYEFLFNNILDCIFIFTLERENNLIKIRDANTSACQTLEYTRKELVCLPFEILVSEKSLHGLSSIINTLIKQSAAQSEIEMITKSRRSITFEFFLRFIHFDDEETIFAVGRDITERKKAETELNSSREKLRIALNSAGKSVWEWDIPGRTIQISKQVPKLLGYLPEEGTISEDDLQTLLGKEENNRLKTLIQKHLRNELPVIEEEFQVTTAAGSSRWIQVEGKIIERSDSGDPVRLLGIVSDIENKKRTEEMLKKAKEEAEEANLRKSLFIADFGHEVRNALSSVSGVADLLGQQETIDRQEMEEYIDILKMSSGTVLELVKDILEFSKIEVEELRLESTCFDLHKLVHSVVRLFSIKNNNQDLIFDTHVSPDVPRHLLGDPTRLSQVLTNLIGNAVKFTGKGSVITEVSMKEYRDTSVSISFSVQDTGIGISAEKLEKIFRPFNQADFSISHKFGGTGLGLAISRKLVNAMGGDIQVESEPGKGSTFSFWGTFKLQESPGNFNKEKNKVPEEKEPKKPMHVLIVEDDELSGKIAEKLFEKNVDKVTVAAGGQEALSLVEENAYDLIVMDGHMEGLNGIEVTRRIRELEREGRAYTPIVALTGDSGLNIHRGFRQAGADRVLIKPLDLKKISDILRET